MFVPLAHVRDDALVAAVVAESLGVRSPAGQPIVDVLAQSLLGGGGATEESAAPIALEEIDYSAVPDWTEPYAIAQIGPRPWFCEPHEPGAEPEMRKAVQEIAAVEGPVHIEDVRQRLRDRWQIGQIGSRIRKPPRLRDPNAQRRQGG